MRLNKQRLRQYKFDYSWESIDDAIAFINDCGKHGVRAHVEGSGGQYVMTITGTEFQTYHFIRDNYDPDYEVGELREYNEVKEELIHA